jgi:hypothetical protein
MFRLIEPLHSSFKKPSIESPHHFVFDP